MAWMVEQRRRSILGAYAGWHIFWDGIPTDLHGSGMYHSRNADYDIFVKADPCSLTQLNYLTGAYEIFAAFANAAASCTRSILGTVLLFVCTLMSRRLGIPGACSLLGGLSCLVSVIPFVFIWKGERIRAGSRFCIALKERKEEVATRIEEQRRREESVRETEGGDRTGIFEQESKEEV